MILVLSLVVLFAGVGLLGSICFVIVLGCLIGLILMFWVWYYGGVVVLYGLCLLLGVGFVYLVGCLLALLCCFTD